MALCRCPAEMVLRPFRLLSPVRFPRHSLRRSRFRRQSLRRPRRPCRGCPRRTCCRPEAPRDRVRPPGPSRRVRRWRSGLRLLFRRRRLYRLRHGRGIRRRLGPRLCLGALDDALGDDRASHPARALKLGTRRRRGLLQTAAPAPSARSGRRQEHQTGGVEPLRPRDDWCGPDKERKGAENHGMGQRRCSQRHTSFPMLRQRGLKQVRYGRVNGRSPPKGSDDLDRMRCGDETAADRRPTTVREQRADVSNVNRRRARDLVWREDVEPGRHFFHERWTGERQNSCRICAAWERRLAACFRPLSLRPDDWVAGDCAPSQTARTSDEDTRRRVTDDRRL